MKFPWENDISEIEKAGSDGGMVAGVCASILFIPAGLSMFPFLAIGTISMVVGSSIGINGGGGHATTASQAFDDAFFEVLGAIQTVHSITTYLPPIWEPHPPEPVKCRVCGKNLLFPGETHVCIPNIS